MAEAQTNFRLATLVGLMVLLFPELCCAATLPSSAVNEQPPATGLVFYADPRVGESLWPLLFQIIQDDLAAGEGDLPEGVVLDKQPIILRGSDDLRGIALPRMVTVKLLGRCDLLPQATLPGANGPLGWVHRVAGGIEPFIFVDCTRLARVLEPAAVRMTKECRRTAMAQAISRVMIHEWIHIATQNATHRKRGLAQPALSVDELIAPANPHRLAAFAR